MTEQAKYVLTGFWNKYEALPKTEDLARKFSVSQEVAEEWKVQFKSSVSVGQNSGGAKMTLSNPLRQSIKTSKSSTKQSSKPLTSEKGPLPLPTPAPMGTLESKLSRFDWHSLLTVGVIKTLWSAFALLAAYRSFDYVFSWFSRMDSIINAVVAALLCTGSVFLIPTSVVMGRMKTSITCGMALLFAVFIFVTINSTVGSLYETKRSLALTSELKASTEGQNKARIDQLEGMIDQTREDGKALTAELAQRLEVQRSFPVGSKEYDRLAGNISTIKGRQDRNSSLLVGYQDELGKLTAITVAVKPRASYSSWWDELLGLAPGSWDLFFGMAFAIALDVMGPVALLISFFLGGKSEDQKG